MPRGLSFAQFQQGLLRAQIEPVYLLDGEEIFFHEEAIRLLGQAVLPEGAAAVDRETMRGGETTLPELIDLASTLRMGGGWRLLVVRDADALRSDGVEPLTRDLGRPNPRRCLVFSDPGFDRRRALYKALIAAAARVDCGPLDDARMAVWIRERLRARGYGLSVELAEAIVAGLDGAGLARLDAELQKLMSAVGAPRPIEPADLSLLGDVPRVEDAFRLAVQILRGERGAAVLAARALLRSGEDPLHLLGGLAWYFRTALKARAAASRRLASHEMTALYGLHPGRVEQFQREIGSTRAEALTRALAGCLRADRELKGDRAQDPAHAIHRLIHGIAGRAERTG